MSAKKDTQHDEIERVVDDLQQPLIVAIKMLRRDNRPVRDEIAEELEERFGDLFDLLNHDTLE